MCATEQTGQQHCRTLPLSRGRVDRCCTVSIGHDSNSLRQEYGRTLDELGSQTKAESDLKEREDVLSVGLERRSGKLVKVGAENPPIGAVR